MVGSDSTASSQYHAFLYGNGTMTDLGTLGGVGSDAYGINDVGQVVGISAMAGDPFKADVRRAFLYSNGTMYDLNTLLPANSGWVLTEADAINNVGQVVGRGYHNGQYHAFLLTIANQSAPTDITAQTAFAHTGGSMNRRTNRFVQTATLTNIGSTTYQGPVSLVLNLPANVVLYGALVNGVYVPAQQTQDGRYYIDLGDAGSLFSPGDTISLSLEFNLYPGSYDDQVLAGPGRR